MILEGVNKCIDDWFKNGCNENDKYIEQ
ncbi:hypothetical protein [Bacillus cereus]